MTDELLVSGSGDSAARVWSLQSLDCLHVLEGHTDTVNEVVIKVAQSQLYFETLPVFDLYCGRLMEFGPESLVHEIKVSSSRQETEIGMKLAFFFVRML